MSATRSETGRPSKRRPGENHGGLPVADPRPVLDGSGDSAAILGVRCSACRYPVAQSGIPWCPACYGPIEPERFAVTGAVWSSTVVAIPVGQRTAPFALAYVDLDDGPRVLVHLVDATALAIGTRVRIQGLDQGDLLAEEAGDDVRHSTPRGKRSSTEDGGGA